MLLLPLIASSEGIYSADDAAARKPLAAAMFRATLLMLRPHCIPAAKRQAAPRPLGLAAAIIFNTTPQYVRSLPSCYYATGCLRGVCRYTEGQQTHALIMNSA